MAPSDPNRPQRAKIGSNFPKNTKHQNTLNLNSMHWFFFGYISVLKYTHFFKKMGILQMGIFPRFLKMVLFFQIYAKKNVNFAHKNYSLVLQYTHIFLNSAYIRISI